MVGGTSRVWTLLFALFEMQSSQRICATEILSDNRCSHRCVLRSEVFASVCSHERDVDVTYLIKMRRVLPK